MTVAFKTSDLIIRVLIKKKRLSEFVKTQLSLHTLTVFSYFASFFMKE